MRFDLKFSVLASVFLHAGFLAAATYAWNSSEVSPEPLGIELMYGEVSSPRSIADQVAPEESGDIALEKKTQKTPPKKVNRQVAQAGPSSNAAKGAVSGREGVANGQEVSPEDRYLYEIKKLLERRKTYPAMAQKMGHTGRVLMRFTLAKDGSVIESEVVEKASYETLNKAADALVRSISKEKPFPHEIRKTTWSITVPIDYAIN
jgi:protein TonB